MSKDPTITLQMDRAGLAAIEGMAAAALLRLTKDGSLAGSDVYALGVLAAVQGLREQRAQIARRRMPKLPSISALLEKCAEIAGSERGKENPQTARRGKVGNHARHSARPILPTVAAANDADASPQASSRNRSLGKRDHQPSKKKLNRVASSHKGRRS